MENNDWREDVNDQRKDHEVRIRALESLTRYVLGAAAGIAFAMGALSTKIAALFGR